MFTSLSPGVIGVSIPDLQGRIDAAKRHGFDGVDLDAKEVVALDPLRVNQMLNESGVRAGGWGLPVDWRSSDENWQRDLAALPDLAVAAVAAGTSRTATWIMPCSNDREYDENRKFHVGRFRPIAAILADQGCRLGLEFIGPKTLRDSQKYPFIYKMGDMLEMAHEIGPNVGLLLDCFHWYTSGGTIEKLNELTNEDVVYVHVNDAAPGVPADDQQDGIRYLPGQTGVIDIAAFMAALRKMEYDGPVVAEPFASQLKDLPDDEARLASTAASMRIIMT